MNQVMRFSLQMIISFMIIFNGPIFSQDILPPEANNPIPSIEPKHQSLAINVDNDSIILDNQTLKVKDAGITQNKIADNAVSSTKLSTSIFYLTSDTMLTQDYRGVILADAENSPIKLTIPDPSSLKGAQFTIKRVDNSDYDLKLMGTIDGQTQTNLIYQYAFITIISDGKKWHKVAEYLTGNDVVPPAPGNQGKLTLQSKGNASLLVSWSPALDDMTQQNDLSYAVCSADKSEQIKTISLCKDHLKAPFTKSSQKLSISDLTETIPNYVNVLVKDKAGNISIYEQAVGIPDGTPPTPGNNGTIEIMSISANNVIISWTPATDKVTASSELIYQVLYSKNLIDDSVESWIKQGKGICEWTSGLKTWLIPNLTENIKYYIAVMVSDTAMNKSLYKVIAATPDGTPPHPGDDGKINISDIKEDSVTLNWTASIDLVSPSQNLKYRVYYSTNKLASTIESWEKQGKAAGEWHANTDTWFITGLSKGTSYYFNVIVRDEIGNKNLYQPIDAKTLLPPPTVVLYNIGLGFGNIGDRQTADNLCINYAAKPKGFENYKMFISYSEEDKIIDWLPDNYIIEGPTGIKIANSKEDLFDGELNSSFMEAQILPGGYMWWSGTEAEGNPDPLNCNSWQSNEAKGYYGTGGAVSFRWIYHSSGTCNIKRYMICAGF